MLRAGMAAPSGKDIRPWSLYWSPTGLLLIRWSAALPYAKMLTQARYAIVVCGDVAQSSYWYLDCSAAAQNILLAAEAQGWVRYGQLLILMKTVSGLFVNIRSFRGI